MPRIPQRLCMLFALRGVDIGYDNLGALCRKCLADGKADSAAPAGHDGHLVFQAHGQFSSHVVPRVLPVPFVSPRPEWNRCAGSPKANGIQAFEMSDF